MEKKTAQKKHIIKGKSSIAKKRKPSIKELNAYAEEYFKTHELPEHLKVVTGSIKAGNKTVKQLMLE